MGVVSTIYEKEHEATFILIIGSSPKHDYDESALIFYCDKLHYCHNIAIMITELITPMLAYYRRTDITELILLSFG